MSMHLLIVGGDRETRLRAAEEHEARASLGGGQRLVVAGGQLPFVEPAAILLTAPSPLLRVDDLEAAFPDRQHGTRLVLTQPAYLIQRWLDGLRPTGSLILTADLELLERVAPEALRMGGPWRAFSVETLRPSTRPPERLPDVRPERGGVEAALAAAFRMASSEKRRTECEQIADLHSESAVVALALASACREVGDMVAARGHLDRVLRLAPEWPAAWFEDGKAWLAADDLTRAGPSFERAATLMPSFVAALSNLGAVCGELGRREDAARCFSRVLDLDPENVGALNNLGVLNRELGRLDDSAQALERAVAVSPAFVFGHYNLGQTRFLMGDYQGALAAYDEGQRRDPTRNRRQAIRRALVLFATGDLDAATRELFGAAASAPPAERDDLFREAYEVASALTASHPALSGQRAFIERIDAALKTRPAH